MLALIKKLAKNFNTQFQKNYPSSLDLEEALSYDQVYNRTTKPHQIRYIKFPNRDNTDLIH